MTIPPVTTLDEVYARISKRDLRAMPIAELMARIYREYTSHARYLEALRLLDAWMIEHPGEYPDTNVLWTWDQANAWGMNAFDGLPDVSAFDPLPDDWKPPENWIDAESAAP